MRTLVIFLILLFFKVSYGQKTILDTYDFNKSLNQSLENFIDILSNNGYDFMVYGTLCTDMQNLGEKFHIRLEGLTIKAIKDSITIDFCVYFPNGLNCDCERIRQRLGRHFKDKDRSYSKKIIRRFSNRKIDWLDADFKDKRYRFPK